jgi:hypothetical protein
LAHAVPARLSNPYSAAQGRKFGVTLGVAFLTLALIARWRGHPTSFVVLGALGIALLGVGLVVPTSLGPVERTWMAAAKGMSRITTPVFMAVLYFVVLTPVALVRRRMGGNPLVNRGGRSGFWAERRDVRGSMNRQF